MFNEWKDDRTKDLSKAPEHIQSIKTRDFREHRDVNHGERRFRMVRQSCILGLGMKTTLV